MQRARRLDLIWLGEETTTYDALKQRADSSGEPMPEYLKRILQQRLEKK
jgi:hypothetical protein